MYKLILKPLLFALGIEQARALAIWLLKFIGFLPAGRKLLHAFYAVEDSSLEREIFGLSFKNPVGLAAGFDLNGEVVEELSALGFGFVEIGSITAEPEVGNPKPRVFRLPKDRAIINRLGHPNRGWICAIENLRRRSKGVKVGCNITSTNSVEVMDLVSKEYLKSFRNLYQYVDYFTVNVPYDAIAGEANTTLEQNLHNIIDPLFEFRRGQSDYRPILIKISPDLNDEAIDLVTDIMIETPLDGVVAVGSTRSREALKTSKLSLQKIGSGRLSGEPLARRAIEVVRRVRQRSGGAYPIIGVGGIKTGEDVKAMIEAGASLVQLYSSFVYEGPAVAGKICKSLLKPLD
ncbi:MAG: quinone-dependent dihydroorotate dehydrogenase [Rikenellaceae bacterium]